MRKVTTVELRSNLGHELDDLPFVITKHGIEIAMCTQVRALEHSKSEEKRLTEQDYFNPKPKKKNGR